MSSKNSFTAAGLSPAPTTTKHSAAFERGRSLLPPFGKRFAGKKQAPVNTATAKRKVSPLTSAKANRSV